MNKTEFRLLETGKKTIDLVIRLVDRYTKQDPFGILSVGLGEQMIKPLAKPGGFYVFYNLIADSIAKYTITVDSEYYLPERREDIKLWAQDDKNPAPAEIELTPAPNYPFSGTATLIRGLLQDPDGMPIREATFKASLSTPDKIDCLGGVNASGEWVLCLSGFPAAKANDLNRIVNLEVKSGEFGPYSCPVEVREGCCSPIGSITLQPN